VYGSRDCVNLNKESQVLAMVVFEIVNYKSCAVCGSIDVVNIDWTVERW
jgi:hypothetical protein